MAPLLLPSFLPPSLPYRGVELYEPQLAILRVDIEIRCRQRYGIRFEFGHTVGGDRGRAGREKEPHRREDEKQHRRAEDPHYYRTQPTSNNHRTSRYSVATRLPDGLRERRLVCRGVVTVSLFSLFSLSEPRTSTSLVSLLLPYEPPWLERFWVLRGEGDSPRGSRRTRGEHL